VTMIEDSIFLERLKIRVIKLVEVAEGDHKQATSEVHNNDDTQVHKESQDSPITLQSQSDDERQNEHKESIEESRSEVSNFSLSMGEDMRQLKDMKAKISEKRTPASVSFLRTTTLIISALLISLVSVQLDEKYEIYNELRFGFEATETTAERHMFMADINYNCRLLYGFEAGYLNNPVTPIYFRPITEKAIANLNKVQFEIIQSRVAQNQTMKDIKIISTTISTLQPDGTIMSQKINVNQAYMIVFIILDFTSLNF